MKVFLANNSGLGDYILMNGATRYVAAQPDVEHVDLLCIGSDYKAANVKWMYRDNPNITIHGEPESNSHKQGRKKCRRRAKHFPDSDKRCFYWDAFPTWWEMMPRHGLDCLNNCWPELFYAAHQAPYSARHEYFHVNRDKDKEHKIFNSLNLPSEYAFCVNKSSRGVHQVNFSNIQLPIFNPDSRPDLIKSCNIFDWMTVIENATELHTVDTSWFHLIKQMKLKNLKFFHHVRHINGMQNVFDSCYVNDEHDKGWTILNKDGNIITSKSQSDERVLDKNGNIIKFKDISSER